MIKDIDGDSSCIEVPVAGFPTLTLAYNNGHKEVGALLLAKLLDNSVARKRAEFLREITRGVAVCFGLIVIFVIYVLFSISQ